MSDRPDDPSSARDSDAPEPRPYVDSATQGAAPSADTKAVEPPPAAPARPTSSAESTPPAAAVETANLAVSNLRADLDSLRQTIAALKAQATPGETPLITALESHHAQLAEDVNSLESRLGGSLSARKEAWDAAVKQTSAKMRRGAGELGSGLGRAWREMRAAAGKAWDEMRREDAETPPTSGSRPRTNVEEETTPRP